MSVKLSILGVFVYRNEVFSRKKKVMDVSVESKPQKFDVWLFAADIVNFIFLKSSKLPPDVVATHFPGFVCKDFSDILKKAVQLIRDTVKKGVDEDFVKFQEMGDVNSDAYSRYAKDLRKTRPCQGFEAEDFLYYCVNLALMAYRFYQEGVRRAQISAVFCVAEDLQDCGSNYRLWDAFNVTAEKIVCRFAGETYVPIHRPLFRGISLESNVDFGSSEVCWKDREIASEVKAHTSLKYSSSAELPNPRHLAREISATSCRRADSRVKWYLKKDPEAMSSLHESLESSLEQLSISSALSQRKDEHATNSTPEESSVLCKRGILKRIPHGNSFGKQIFKLSPINRIKAESIYFQ